MTDEKGLFLLVQPSGGKLWRFKFRVDGRDEKGLPKRVEKKVGFGTYPDVNLKEARRLRDEARASLAAGVDPAEKKRRDAHTAKVSAAKNFLTNLINNVAQTDVDFPAITASAAA